MAVDGLGRWARQIESDFVQQRRREGGRRPSRNEIALHVLGTMKAVKEAADRDDPGIRDAREGAAQRAESARQGVESLAHLREGLQARLTTSGYASLGDARATYDIPDGNDDHIDLTGQAGETARRTFRYKGQEFVITAHFVDRGEGKSGVGEVEITRK